MRIRDELVLMGDEKYRAFMIPLIPSVDPETVIGIRTPELRAFAREIARRGDARAFLDDLPHRYFEEDQLHAFIVSGIKDYETCVEEVCRFLPRVNNWATCDQMNPKVFKKHRPELLERIRIWLASGETYTVRFALGMLMQHFLDGDFDPVYLEMAADVRSEEYYVRMMAAWYFATALAKQYDAALPYMLPGRLEEWTRRKAIRKALESRRIPEERKDRLKSLR
ncbi:MAG: DNA alkylation repair protein [Clostridia bacterium]|nr:DNA alkylation repair protein [Clostridia bacterium]